MSRSHISVDLVEGRESKAISNALDHRFLATWSSWLMKNLYPDSAALGVEDTYLTTKHEDHC